MSKLSGLSNEVKSKFKLIKPKTLGQALRIDGITPAAVYILLSHVKRDIRSLKGHRWANLAQIDTFSRFTQVSRETITSLVKYENYLIKSNKTLNLIGKSTINQIWIRHFLDSSQVIDFIDKNTNRSNRFRFWCWFSWFDHSNFS